MTATPSFFPLLGGLDQASGALSIPPGRVIGCLNHECVSRGYARTEGYERIDGRAAPSEATFHTLTFTAGAVAFAANMTVLGNTSGATARVVAAARLDSGTFGAGAAGTLAVDNVVGTFQTGELLRVAGVTHATLDAPPALSDRLVDDDHDDWFAASVEYRRSLIAKPPGAGAVRGVLWYDGALHSWRDNAAQTAGILHRASTAGWAPVDLGRLLYFTGGGPYQIMAGDSIVGDQSGATATVRYVAQDAVGDWADSNATGVLVIDNLVGVIEDESISVGANLGIAAIGAASAPASFPAGGRYEFDIFNFYGSIGFERAYGVNGVGPAFEFDGDSIIPILTGMPDDRPFLITEHRNHLFLGFPKGSLQHSELGEPRSFDARFGAAELGMGHELTNIVGNTSASLIVTTDTSTAVLTGNDSSDWVLEGLNKDAGAKLRTAQQVGKVVYLDNVGLRSIEASSAYGNFKMGVYTALISTELENKRKAGVTPVGSCVIKSKDQYLLFFSDGSGISVYFGRKNPECMLFEYPFVVTCLHLAEVDGVERLFAGGDDGFVYEINKGTSFDGAEIEAFLALPFGFQGDPRALKRYHKAAFEIIAGARSDISFMAQFDYGSDYQQFVEQSSLEVSGEGGLWGIPAWGDFVWSAPASATAEVWLNGVGANMGLIVKSSSSRMKSYVLQGVTLMFSLRGRKR